MDDDKQLIERAISNHNDFKILVKRYYSVMLVVAKAIIGESLAEEVVQEAWLSAYKNLNRFEGRSSIKTWLITLTANEAKTRLRKESRTLYMEDLSLNNDNTFLNRYGPNGRWVKPSVRWHSDSPEALLNNEQFKVCLNKFMSDLSIQARSALILKDMHGISLDEICNILDVSASNVRVLIHRARHKIFENIESFQETGKC